MNRVKHCFLLPGTEFLYTTHGYTLLSAVIEGAASATYPALCRQLFRDLGMRHTYLDQNDQIIYNRSRLDFRLLGVMFIKYRQALYACGKQSIRTTCVMDEALIIPCIIHDRDRDIFFRLLHVFLMRVCAC